MPKSPYQPTLPARWNQRTLDCIIATGTPPPMAARILAIVHTAIYDAWAMYDDVAISTRIAGHLRRPEAERTEAHCDEAISYAAYRVLKTYFPASLLTNNPTKLEDWMQSLQYDPTNTSENPNTPAGMGNLMAKAILDYRAGDGANTWQTITSGKPYADYSGYQPSIPALQHPSTPPFNSPEGDDQEWWQPLHLPNKSPQTFLAPHWGLVQPFALRFGAEFRPVGGPEDHNSPRFKSQCQQVLAYSAGLNDTTKAIAEYWADGPKTETPPGHWCVLAQEVAKRDRHDASRDVKMFFVLANALMDAGIACWDTKRAFNYVRPVTAIRHLFKGQDIEAWGGPGSGKVKMKGEAWMPYQAADFVTPPFPEYPSGHSTFSAASAEILQRFTGSDYFGHKVVFAKGSSKIDPDNTPTLDVHLSWDTFSDAAEQAGMSRLYGGIHFEDGNIRGQDLGRKVAAKVWEKARRLWEGRS
jgi:hypothetical protein